MDDRSFPLILLFLLMVIACSGCGHFLEEQGKKFANEECGTVYLHPIKGLKDCKSDYLDCYDRYQKSFSIPALIPDCMQMKGYNVKR